MKDITAIIKKTGKLIAAFILWAILFEILSNYNRSEIFNVFAMTASVACTYLIFTGEYNKKILAVLIMLVTFTITRLNIIAVAISVTLSILVYFYFSKKHTADSLDPHDDALFIDDEWIDYNRFVPFRIEKYSFIPKEYLTVKRGILSKNSAHVSAKNLSNYIIHENRSLIQRLFGLSSVSFKPWISPIPGTKHQDIDILEDFWIRNIPAASAERLIILINT